MSDLEVELYSDIDDRTYRFVLEVGADWDVSEVWWVDSPFECLDPQGILILEKLSNDRYYLLSENGSDEVDGHRAYLFYADYEDGLREQVLFFLQEERKYDYDPEAIVELYGV